VLTIAFNIEDVIAPTWEFEFPKWEGKRVSYNPNTYLSYYRLRFQKTHQKTGQRIDLNITYFKGNMESEPCQRDQRLCSGDTFEPISCDIGGNSIYCVWHKIPMHGTPYFTTRSLHRYDIIGDFWVFVKEDVQSVNFWENSLYLITQTFATDSCRSSTAVIEKCNPSDIESGNVLTACTPLKTSLQLGCINQKTCSGCGNEGYQNQIQSFIGCPNQSQWNFFLGELLVTMNLIDMKLTSKIEIGYFNCVKIASWQNDAILTMFRNEVTLPLFEHRKEIQEMQQTILDLTQTISQNRLTSIFNDKHYSTRTIQECKKFYTTLEQDLLTQSNMILDLQFYGFLWNVFAIVCFAVCGWFGIAYLIQYSILSFSCSLSNN
jgi:hypothetical protein